MFSTCCFPTSSFAKADASFLFTGTVLEAYPEKKNNFSLCTGVGVREGRGAPVRAPAPPTQLLPVKHVVLEHDFFRNIPARSNLLFFTASGAR